MASGEPSTLAHRLPRAVSATPLLGGLLFLLASGCADQTAALQRRIAQLEQTVQEKERQLFARQGTIAELQRQLDDARRLPPDWQKYIFYPERLEIDGLSGGADYDGKPGDDGVTVYLKPLDQAGDIVKVAGDIVIQLYDLANPPGRNLVGEYRFPVDTIGELWHGKLMTYHYTLKCPWQRGPPAHPEITIRATFVDYLTKKVMSDVRTCTVKLPPQR